MNTPNIIIDRNEKIWTRGNRITLTTKLAQGNRITLQTSELLQDVRSNTVPTSELLQDVRKKKSPQSCS
jgi:hypothetical protein